MFQFDIEQFIVCTNVSGLNVFNMKIIIIAHLWGFLSGDELYPDNPDYNGTEDPLISNKCIQQLEKESVKCNRSFKELEMRWSVLCTIEQTCGHVGPKITFYLPNSRL